MEAPQRDNRKQIQGDDLFSGQPTKRRRAYEAKPVDLPSNVTERKNRCNCTVDELKKDYLRDNRTIDGRKMYYCHTHAVWNIITENE